MTTTAVDLVKRYYGSLASGQRTNLMDILDPNIVLDFQEGFPGGRPRYRGIKEYFEDFLELIYGAIDFEFVPEQFLESGAHVVTTGRMKGRATGSGVPFDIPFAHAWTSNGRQLTHARFYSDTAILRDAVAGRPALNPTEQNKELVLAGMKGVFIDRDPTVLDRLFSHDYRQHNPSIANGTAAIKTILKSLPANFSYQPGLAVAEGDYVMIHGRYVGWGPKPMVGVDIFQVANGKIAEHWDVLQEEVPATQSASGNSMLTSPQA